QQRRHVVGLERDRLVEVGERQVGLPVAEIRPAALVVIARLARGHGDGARQVGERVLVVVAPGRGGTAARQRRRGEVVRRRCARCRGLGGWRGRSRARRGCGGRRRGRQVEYRPAGGGEVPPVLA